MHDTRASMVADVVLLKSGGPPMTVREVTPEGVVCMWFDKQDMDHEAEFTGETLVKPVQQQATSQRAIRSRYVVDLFRWPHRP